MVKNNPLVSVIIPAYNAEKFLKAAVDSIISQTYKNLDIIIINDASKDDTLRISKSYAKKDSRVRVFDNEKNMGIGGNRARGIELARGKYICWQDADDISLPDRIESQVEYLENHPSVGVVGGFIHFFDEIGDQAIRKYAENDARLRRTVFRYNPVAQPASMVRAEVYKKIGTYSSEHTVNEDLDMLFRIGRKYEFANVQQLVLKYRQTSSSLTRHNLKRMEKSGIQLRFKYAKCPEYKFTIVDFIYNVLQYLTMFMPVNLRMALFKIVRGDK